MGIQVNFNLRGAKANKETPVNLIVRYAGYQIIHSTGLKIHPDFWNAGNSGKGFQQAKKSPKFPEYASFNAKLTDIRSKAHKAYDKLVDQLGHVPTPTEFKAQLAISLGQVKQVEVEARKVTFLLFIEQHIKDSETRVNGKTGKLISPNTIKPYRTVLRHLKEFKQTWNGVLDWEGLDHKFASDFHNYLLLQKKMMINSIGKQFSTINAFVRQAEDQKIISRGVIAPFKVAREEVDNIYLTREELRQWQELDLSHSPRLDRVRDLFLISCHTASRYSDLHKYASANIRVTQGEKGERRIFQIVQQKTQKKVAVAVHPVVDEIHTKYGGALPNVPVDQVMNRYLKEIGAMIPLLQEPYEMSYVKGGKQISDRLPKYKYICTHTGRRTFATLNVLAEIPTYKIMNATGHATEKDFWKYVKMSNHEKAASMGDDWAAIAAKA